MSLCELEEKTSWHLFLDSVRERSSPSEFENWFSHIKLVEAKAEGIILEVPNIFVREYLLDNYKKDLGEFLPKLANGEPAIEFQIKEPKKKAEAAPPTPAQTKDGLPLNHLYTFDNFIEGPSNQFVKSAAVGVATRPGKTYNPLFIHGGVGLGKTHLLHGIGHYIKTHQKKLRIQCITTEAFINDLVDNLRNKSVDRMKRFYRNLDILLVDDIQFLQNRLNFEEEFCNTFEALINQNKQIVITSDKPPSLLKLSERMIARMEWGLVANIGIPDLETRVAIIQHKAEQKGLTLDNEVAFFIAEHIYNNVRQIEGAINKLLAYFKLIKLKLTKDIVEKILAEMLQKNPQRKVSVEDILKSISAIYEIKISDLKGETRTKEIAFARQVAMFLAKEMVDDSLQKIAASFGGKTHSTLLHAHKKISQELQENELLARQIQMARRNIETG